MDLKRYFIAIVSLALFACTRNAGRNDTGAADRHSVAPRTLPAFSLVTDSLALQDGVDAVSSPLAITKDGLIVLTASPGATNRVRVVDTSGRVLRTFARTGKGPGEAQVPAEFFTVASNLYSYDMANLRLTGFTLEGKFKEEQQFDGAIFPFNLVDDTIDFLHFSSEGRLEIRRSSITGHSSRILLDHRDSVFASQFLAKFEEPGQRRPVYPARASSATSIAIGDPTTYRIAEWDIATRKATAVFGRTLPPISRSDREVARELESLSRYRDPSGQSMDPASIDAQRRQLGDQKLPYFFSLRGLRFDAAGRLLVVGAQHDSVVIDVFSDTVFIGRVELDCPGFAGSWDLDEGWAAFLCDGELGPVVKVYHVN